MWIIDAYGTKDEVEKLVDETLFDTFVDDTTKRLRREEAKLTLATAPEERVALEREVASLKADLAKLDDDERDLFDAAKDACVAILRHVKSPYCGVTARPSRNPGDAPRGKTFTLSTSSYGWQ